MAKNHDTMKALQDHGFEIPPEIQEIPAGTNVKRDKFYDQIAVWNRAVARRGSNYRNYTRVHVMGANIFDFFDHVFTEADEGHYKSVIARETKRVNKVREARGDKPVKGNWGLFGVAHPSDVGSFADVGRVAHGFCR